jgi:hypothetical protein
VVSIADDVRCCTFSNEEKMAAFDEYIKIEARLKRILGISPSASLLNQELSIFLNSDAGFGNRSQNNTASATNSLVIFRRLNSITLTDATAPTFTDLTPSGELNVAAANFLEALHDSMSHITAAGHNLAHYTINWHPLGITDLVSAEHKAYLAAFASTIRSRCIASIEQSNLFDETRSLDEEYFISEVVDHWRHAQALCRDSFCLPEVDFLFGLLTKPQSCDHNKPVLLLAPLGSGKSYVMAAVSCKLNSLQSKLAQTSESKLAPTSVCDDGTNHKASGELRRFVIVRFVNATSQSRTLTGLLSSICSQLLHILHSVTQGFAAEFICQGPASHVGGIQLTGEESLEELTVIFSSLLSSTSERASIFILIDGLDECACRFHMERSVDWVPSSLPKNVRMLISLNGQIQAVLQESCAETLKERINGPLVGVAPLSAAHQKDLVEAVLCQTTLPLDSGAVRRRLPKALHEQLLAMSEASNPFFLSLFVRLWCWDPRCALSDSGIPLSLPSLMAHMLEQLLVAHGEPLVNSVLGLLVAAERVSSGVTELELVDLLSTMDPVLDDACAPAPHDAPPHATRTQHKRMRRMLWVALKQDLVTLGVISRCTDEVQALWCLSHPSFAAVARQRQVLPSRAAHPRPSLGGGLWVPMAARLYGLSVFLSLSLSLCH